MCLLRMEFVAQEKTYPKNSLCKFQVDNWNLYILVKRQRGPCLVCLLQVNFLYTSKANQNRHEKISWEMKIWTKSKMVKTCEIVLARQFFEEIQGWNCARLINLVGVDLDFVSTNYYKFKVISWCLMKGGRKAVF